MSSYIPNFLKVMVPLYDLLKEGTKWQWGEMQEKAFTEVKHAFSTDSILVHYCQGKPLVLQTDASGQGLGDVLLQPDVNGVLRPVTYESRVLQPAVKNYSQIEREALAIVFGVQEFRQYL